MGVTEVHHWRWECNRCKAIYVIYDEGGIPSGWMRLSMSAGGATREYTLCLECRKDHADFMFAKSK